MKVGHRPLFSTTQAEGGEERVGGKDMRPVGGVILICKRSLRRRTVDPSKSMNAPLVSVDANGYSESTIADFNCPCAIQGPRSSRRHSEKRKMNCMDVTGELKESRA